MLGVRYVHELRKKTKEVEGHRKGDGGEGELIKTNFTGKHHSENHMGLEGWLKS